MKFSSCNLRLRSVILPLLLFPVVLLGQISWQTVNSTTSYDNRDEHGYVELNGKFYLIGGAYMGRPNVQVYDPTTNSWTNKASVPEDFHHLQAVTYNGLIWVMCSWKGGYQAEQNLSHVYSYNPASDSWTQRMTIPSNRRRGSAGVVVYNHKFYILGGNSGGHGPQGDVKNWVDVYDPAANGGAGSWNTLANMPIGRDHFQAVEKNGKIYAIGGRDSGTSGNFFANIRSQVDFYDIATNTWTTLPSSANLPTLRAGSCNIVMDDEVLVMLGVGNARENEFRAVEAFNTTTHTWRTLPQAPHARSGTQAVPFGRDIYVASGIGSVYGGTDLYQQDKMHIPLPGNVPPTVTNPSNVATVSGNDAVFSVQVSGGSNISYQWERQNNQQSWQPIAGAVQASYTLSGVTSADDSSRFRVLITHSLGVITSDAALLTVRCDGVFLGNTDPIVLEAEHYHQSYTRNGQSWQLASQTGAVGQILEAGPNMGANFNTNYMSQSPETQYDINFSQGGTYYIWIRTFSATFEDNSCHAALDSIATGSADRITYDTYQQWGWTNLTMDGHAATFVVPGAGIHCLHLWMREDGIRIDRILLTQNANYTPSGQGPAESSLCGAIASFPIDLGDWRAVTRGPWVKLSWTTLNERNNAWFAIEKSEDQQFWMQLKKLPGAGNSSEPKHYQYTDAEPWLGTSYYRLKQVDHDGAYTYSPTLSVFFENLFSDRLEVFPNPVKDRRVHIRFSHDGEESTLILRNLWGAEIKRFSSLSAKAGIEETVLELDDLQTGIYLLQLENKYASRARKIVVQ
jgi:N-acetylneuraminic acid mutarotase